MLDEFIGHLQVLSKADSLIVRIWLAVMARRFALFVFAGLIAVFGLAMADIAGFFQLRESVGPVWAAAIVALADFIVAALIALYAGTARPGPELDLAMEVRGLAIKSLQADARNLEASAKAYTQQFRDARDRISGFVGNPLDTAATKLLLPAVIAIVKGLRARHAHNDHTDPA
jgi:hypothetical protein